MEKIKVNFYTWLKEEKRLVGTALQDKDGVWTEDTLHCPFCGSTEISEWDHDHEGFEELCEKCEKTFGIIVEQAK
ncbi:MAG: hypothetical protein GWN00_07225 [Aliifodinibius sp.]|nr:hypothetical protein [Fodinibius sp.]NIV11020.1 hypothetical protein [Fodinibius sp.]NIY24607.1 hypothetical protein [Fodinibius sp.]